MNYQGDNQFTKVVKALKFIQEQFNVVLKNMDKVECGMTQIGIGNLIANAMSPKNGGRTRRNKKGTIIDALGDRLNIENLKQSSICKIKESQIDKIRNMTQKAQMSGSGIPSPNFQNNN
jgi:hypothetical protein